MAGLRLAETGLGMSGCIGCANVRADGSLILPGGHP